ncbi:hypothetical protein [Salinactinospora qingdaonensis]
MRQSRIDRSTPSQRTVPETRRNTFLNTELRELAGLFLVAGAAHIFVVALGHQTYGGPLLIGLGIVVICAALGYRWWRHNRTASELTTTHSGDERLWRIRVEVRDVPGGLAPVTARLARLGVDIRFVQIHPGYTDVVDEFLASAPASVTPEELAAAVTRAGGRDPVIQPADIHELSDTTSRTLALVSGLISAPATLPAALRGLSGAREVTTRPAPPNGMGADDIAGSVMCLSAPDGGVLVLNRDGIAFTQVEFARCRALADVAAQLSGARNASNANGGSRPAAPEGTE